MKPDKGSLDLSRVESYLDQRFGLDALWVFVSEASGSARADSDVDLGALFQRTATNAELLDARRHLAAELGRDVGLVDLDRASPILVMQVLRHGRLEIDRSPAHRIRLMGAAPLRYEDVKIMRREAERSLIQRVRAG